MPLFQLNKELIFPPVQYAEGDGLLSHAVCVQRRTINIERAKVAPSEVKQIQDGGLKKSNATVVDNIDDELGGEDGDA